MDTTSKGSCSSPSSGLTSLDLHPATNISRSRSKLVIETRLPVIDVEAPTHVAYNHPRPKERDMPTWQAGTRSVVIHRGLDIEQPATESDGQLESEAESRTAVSDIVTARTIPNKDSQSLSGSLCSFSLRGSSLPMIRPKYVATRQPEVSDAVFRARSTAVHQFSEYSTSKGSSGNIQETTSGPVRQRVRNAHIQRNVFSRKSASKFTSPKLQPVAPLKQKYFVIQKPGTKLCNKFGPWGAQRCSVGPQVSTSVDEVPFDVFSISFRNSDSPHYNVSETQLDYLSLNETHDDVYGTKPEHLSQKTTPEKTPVPEPLHTYHNVPSTTTSRRSSLAGSVSGRAKQIHIRSANALH